MKSKPQYTLHRDLAPPAAGAGENVLLTDAGIILDLKLRGPGGDQMIRGGIHFGGWQKVEGYVRLTGGAAPTITLQPLEVVHEKHPDGTIADRFIGGATIGPFNNDEKFTFDAWGGLYMFRVHGTTGNPTRVEMFFSGAIRDLEALHVG